MWVGAVLLVCLTAGRAGAQPPAAAPEVRVAGEADAAATARAAHAVRRAANPPGLSLDIRVRGERSRFAQGEPISLDLTFRDASGQRYAFDPIAYDRSGRLGVDRLVVAPASGVEDPLRDYYRALGFGFIGGGASTPPAPLDGPRTVALDLNEWVRFVRPGTYAVYVESRRFLGPEGTVIQRSDPVTVVSNLLSIEITPGSPDHPAASGLSARALRFADSVAAARELARRLVDMHETTTRVGTEGYDLVFGLFGTPHRVEALAALRTSLAAANQAVNEVVPRVAAFLDVMVALPRRPASGEDADEESAERVRERTTLHPCRLAFWQHQALAAGLRGTPGDVARAAVAFTQDVPPNCPPLPRLDVDRVLPPLFLQLSSSEQQLMLSHRWGQIAGAAMLPALQELIAVGARADPETRDLALVRLGELMPDEAAQVSRDDLIAGRFRFSARSLRMQQDDTPAVVAALSAHLRRARDQSLPLSSLQDGRDAGARGLLPALARFGTRPDSDALDAWPDTALVPCAARVSVIALALRVDDERGQRLLRESLNDRSSRCGEMVLEDLARAWPQRLSERAVIDALWHERGPVAASAARALASVGTDDGRRALWRRLDEWHARWRGREDALRIVIPQADDPVTQEIALAHALRTSLLRGRGWLTTADDRLRVRASCLTEACREEFSPFRGGPPVGQVLVQAEEWTGDAVYRVDGHVCHAVADVIDRLVLYPAAVTIAWQAGSSHAPDRASALYDRLAAAAATRGVRLLARPTLAPQ